MWHPTRNVRSEIPAASRIGLATPVGKNPQIAGGWQTGLDMR